MAASSFRPSLRSRTAGAALALVLALGAVVGTTTAPAEASPGQFVARINGTRAARGLAPLAVSGQLSAKAQAWAAHMASVGQISHSGNLASGVSANWTKLGENVGVGGTVDALHNAFVASPSHLRNIVDPEYDFIGVGVVHAGGVMYTAHVFMAVAGSAAP
ncbi:MAG TPA: CAP domain-containing protein, partial [Acidimicrobiales bacterium]|nr:CAP domain-containing protein [Acidimicrobiales bacterium]